MNDTITELSKIIATLGVIDVLRDVLTIGDI